MSCSFCLLDFNQRLKYISAGLAIEIRIEMHILVTLEISPLMLQLQKLQVAKHMWAAQFIELLSPPVLQFCQQKGMHGKASCLLMTDIL